MRLPWVPRDAFSATCTALDAERAESHRLGDRILAEIALTVAASLESARLREQNVTLNARTLAAEGRYDTLLEKYHALKVVGAVSSEPVVKVEPDIVSLAIIKKAGTSRALRSHFTQYVTLQRAEGVTEEVIAAKILEGVSDDGGIPG